MNHSSSDSKLVKIGVFYDGGYFARVSNYYRYNDPRKSRLSILGLHDFIRERLHEIEEVDKHYCQIVDAHYFRGRFSAYDAARKPNQLFNERTFDDALMYANVVTHYLPVNQGRNGFVSEKGIDVWFALECYELAVLKRYNVVVLITGDRDHLPLLRKLSALGVRVMLLYWDIDFAGLPEERPIRTSQALINEATYEVNMVNVLNNRKHSAVAENIFISQELDEEESRAAYNAPPDETQTIGVNEPTAYNFQSVEQIVTTGPVLLGKIHHIDHANGHGYLHGINNVYDNLIFFRNAQNAEAFNQLEKYDVVDFQVAQNARGDYATNVKIGADKLSEV